MTTRVTPEPGERIVVPAPRLSFESFAINLAMLVVGGAFFLPMTWLALAALDANAEWAIRPPDLTLANLQKVVSLPYGVQSLGNSFYIALTTTVVATLVSFLAAYALSRAHIPAKRPMMLLLLFSTGLPIMMMLVPLYQLYVALGWLDSLFTTSLFLAAASVPFSIWLLKNFIDSVPVELEHAARMEGAGTFGTLGRVVLPLALPGVTVAAIYTFINAWGAFIVPLVLNLNPADQPASIKVFFFLGTQGVVEFGALAMFSLMFTIPVLVLYWVGARWFSGSFAFGGAIRG